MWDNRTEFMCPRATSGAFECSFDPSMPFIADKHYTEGNAWQWTWSVSHTSHTRLLVHRVHKPLFCVQVPGDPMGLVRLFSSPERFCERLQEFMLRGALHPRYNH